MTNKQEKANVFTHAFSCINRRVFDKRLVPCDESQPPKSGSLNKVIFIVFEDGIEWVFRSPRKAFRLQADTASEVFRSEVATLRYPGDMGSVPIPQVFSYW